MPRDSTSGHNEGVYNEMVPEYSASVPVVKAPDAEDSSTCRNNMAKLIILCLAALAVCDAGLIPGQLVYPEFPNLNTVHHGHGATSYQNVQVQNYGSVPIPKELQVDDGNEHLHSPYLHEDLAYDLQSFEQHHYEKPRVAIEHVVVSTEAPYGIDEHAEHVELEPHGHYSPSNYEHYNDEVDYEYH